MNSIPTPAPRKPARHFQDSGDLASARAAIASLAAVMSLVDSHSREHIGLALSQFALEPGAARKQSMVLRQIEAALSVKPVDHAAAARSDKAFHAFLDGAIEAPVLEVARGRSYGIRELLDMPKPMLDGLNKRMDDSEARGDQQTSARRTKQ